MKTGKKILGFVSAIATGLLLSAMLSGVVSEYFVINQLQFTLTMVLVFAAITAPFAFTGAKRSTFANAGLLTEIWLPYLQENLFPTTSFLELSEDHSQFIKHKTVHLPQAGATPGMVKNNTNVPLAIISRTDTDFTYNIDNFKLVPTVVTDLEELQISYDKVNSIMGNYVRMAKLGIENIVLYSWAPPSGARMVRTTGSATGNALAPGATGTRNAITLADISALKNILDLDFVPEEDRYILMPSSIYNNQLLAINNIQAFYAYNKPVIQDGNAKEIFGFKVLVRPSVLVYDTSAVIKALNTDTTITGGLGFGAPAVTVSTDNMAVLAFQMNFISRAKSDVKLFSSIDRPEYYGSIFSAEFNLGASPLRPSYIGTAVLVQQ